MSNKLIENRDAICLTSNKWIKRERERESEMHAWCHAASEDDVDEPMDTSINVAHYKWSEKLTCS